MSSLFSAIKWKRAEETIGLVAEAIQKRVVSVALPNDRAQITSLSRATASWHAVKPTSISLSAAASSAVMSRAMAASIECRFATGFPPTWRHVYRGRAP